MIEWGHSLIEVLGVTVPIILYIANEKRKDRKQAMLRADEAKKDNDQRHKENKERLDELLGERQYLKPHDHIETGNEPLMADGIIRKRNGR